MDLLKIQSNRIHVSKVTSRKGNWGVLRPNGKKASFVFKKKEDAIEKAREMCKREYLLLIIHGEEGKVENVENYTRP